MGIVVPDTNTFLIAPEGGNGDAKGDANDKTTMPPPNSSPYVLQSEINALSTGLKKVMVKAGQVFQFYGATRNLHIQRHASSPPHSLIAGLGREVETYDQVCDAIESHITQAISSLKRDVEIEERRIKDAQDAALAIRARSKSESVSPASARLPQPIISEGTIDASIDPSSSKTLTQSQVKAIYAASLPSARRQSAISISSLHRPVIPQKLDLSMASFRFTPEEASIFTSGLASPVTLAPKSARPLDYPPDLMVPFTGTETTSQGVGIDLDMAVVGASTSEGIGTTADRMPLALDPGVDNGTGDKSIALDLGAFSMSNISDLFGNTADANSNDPDGAKLFAPPVLAAEISVPDLPGDKMDTTVHALGIGTPGTFTGEDDLFASIDTSAASTAQYIDQTGRPQVSSMPPRSTIGLSPPAAADTSPSPSSILASLTSDGAHTTSTIHALHTLPSGDASFELDLDQLGNGFYGAKNNDEDMMMMEEFLDMDKKDHLSNEMS